MRLQIPNGEIVVNIGNLLAILGGASVRIFVEKLADFFHYAPTCLPLDFGLFFTFPWCFPICSFCLALLRCFLGGGCSSSLSLRLDQLHCSSSVISASTSSFPAVSNIVQVFWYFLHITVYMYTCITCWWWQHDDGAGMRCTLYCWQSSSDGCNSLSTPTVKIPNIHYAFSLKIIQKICKTM